MAKVAEFNIDFTDLKVLTDHLNKAEGKIDMLASSAKSDFKKLQMAIDPVKRATKAFTDQVLIAQKALVTGQASQKEYAQVFKQIQANANAAGLTINQFGQVANVNTRKMKRFGAVGMQQVGYQVQDFAVQVQGGTNMLVALGQQGSQLLGIFGPAGAIGGMILAIGTGLAGAFIAAKNASEDATEKAKSYNDVLKDANTRIKELTASNKLRLSGMKDISEFELTDQLRKLKEYREGFAAFLSDPDAMMPGAILTAPQEDYFKRVDDMIATTEKKLAKLRTEMSTEADLDAADDAAETAAENAKESAKILATLKDRFTTTWKLYGLEGSALLRKKMEIEDQKTLNELLEKGLKTTDEEYITAKNALLNNRRLVVSALEKEEAEKAATQAIKDQEKAQRENARAAKLAHKMAKEAAKDVLDLSKSIGNSMEDAMMSMVDGTKSVKDAFKDMASSIIKELYRIYVVKKITGMITGAIDAKFAPDVAKTAAVAGVAANGGPVQAGQRYVVGERGPEMFTPNVSGTITPNSQMGGSGVTVVQNINISTGVQQTVRAEIRQMMPQIAQSAKAAVVDSKRRGGNYGRAMA